MKSSREFENFERTMRELMKVSHVEVKAKLDAEKATKKRKKSKRRPSSASCEASDRA